MLLIQLLQLLLFLLLSILLPSCIDTPPQLHLPHLTAQLDTFSDHVAANATYLFPSATPANFDADSEVFPDEVTAAAADTDPFPAAPVSAATFTSAASHTPAPAIHVHAGATACPAAAGVPAIVSSSAVGGPVDDTPFLPPDVIAPYDVAPAVINILSPAPVSATPFPTSDDAAVDLLQLLLLMPSMLLLLLLIVILLLLLFIAFCHLRMPLLVIPRTTQLLIPIFIIPVPTLSQPLCQSLSCLFPVLAVDSIRLLL